MKPGLLRLLSLGSHCKQREPAFSCSKRAHKCPQKQLYLSKSQSAGDSHIQESLYRDLVTISSASQIKPGYSVYDFDTSMAMNHPVNNQAGMFVIKRRDPVRDQPTTEQVLSLHLSLQCLNNPAAPFTEVLSSHFSTILIS